MGKSTFLENSKLFIIKVVGEIRHIHNIGLLFVICGLSACGINGSMDESSVHKSSQNDSYSTSLESETTPSIPLINTSIPIPTITPSPTPIPEYLLPLAPGVVLPADLIPLTFGKNSNMTLLREYHLPFGDHLNISFFNYFDQMLIGIPSGDWNIGHAINLGDGTISTSQAFDIPIVDDVIYSTNGKWVLIAGDEKIIVTEMSFEHPTVYQADRKNFSSDIITKHQGFSLDSSLLWYLSGDKMIFIDTQTWSKISEIKGPSWVGALLFPDNKTVAFPSKGIFNIRTGEKLQDSYEVKKSIKGFLSADGTKLVLVTNKNESISMWKVGESKLILNTPLSLEDDQNIIAIMPDASGYIISDMSDSSYTSYSWDNELIFKLNMPFAGQYREVIEFSPDGKFMAIAVHERSEDIASNTGSLFVRVYGAFKDSDKFRLIQNGEGSDDLRILSSMPLANVEWRKKLSLEQITTENISELKEVGKLFNNTFGKWESVFRFSQDSKHMSVADKNLGCFSITELLDGDTYYFYPPDGYLPELIDFVDNDEKIILQTNEGYSQRKNLYIYDYSSNEPGKLLKRFDVQDTEVLITDDKKYIIFFNKAVDGSLDTNLVSIIETSSFATILELNLPRKDKSWPRSGPGSSFILGDLLYPIGENKLDEPIPLPDGLGRDFSGIVANTLVYYKSGEWLGYDTDTRQTIHYISPDHLFWSAVSGQYILYIDGGWGPWSPGVNNWIADLVIYDVITGQTSRYKQESQELPVLLSENMKYLLIDGGRILGVYN